MLISPAHSQLDDEESDTKAKRFGRALHMRLIEPDLYKDTYVVAPSIYKRSAAEKAFWQLWEDCRAGKPYDPAMPVTFDNKDKDVLQAEVLLAEVCRGEYDRVAAMFRSGLAGKEFVNQDDIDNMGEIAEAVEKTKHWQLYKQYDGETAGFVVDPVTGVLRKSKADLFGDAIVDIKTTECAAPSVFTRQIIKYQYDLSGAYYQDNFDLLIGKRLDIILLAVEKKKPFGVAFYRLPNAMLSYGRKQYRLALDRYAECLRTNDWPCYPDEIVEIEAPGWMKPGTIGVL
jgi:hypothetical protein